MQSVRWQELVVSPGDHRHLVQLYTGQDFLMDAVAAWLAPALREGGGAVLACSDAHAKTLLFRLEQMGVDVAVVRREGRIVAYDAEDFLRAFMRNGVPESTFFLPVLRDALVRIAKNQRPGSEVRAWGEMVDILAKRGERRAAERLEAIWNEAIQQSGIRLLCSYEVDHLSAGADQIASACSGHSCLFTEPDESAFERMLDTALVEEFGERRAALMRADLGTQRVAALKMQRSENVFQALRQKDPEAAVRVAERLRRPTSHT